VILVLTGTEVYPFGRLVEAVDELQRSGAVSEEFFLQLGSTPAEPRHVRFERFLSFGRVLEEIQRASVVITHAGAGTALVCMQHGKHPVLVPRLARFGEVIDDHQVPFAEKMADAGLAAVVHDVAQLGPAIASARSKSPPVDAVGRANDLTTWLEGFWRGLGPTSGAPRSR
jgi:UDP-N-acetylglucosamine transferase subunit ALG13